MHNLGVNKESAGNSHKTQIDNFTNNRCKNTNNYHYIKTICIKINID